MYFNLKHPHYFTSKVNREVAEVYGYTAIHSLALSLVFIFEPIFLFQRGFSLPKIMFFYLQVYLWYVLLIGFGAKFAGRFGYKHAIFTSNVVYVVYWIALFSIHNTPSLFYVAPILFAMQKSFFWTAYDADLAINSSRFQRSREVGVLFSMVEIIFILGPILGGLMVELYGFQVLFFTSGFLMLFASYPLFRSPEIYTHKHNFTFKRLFEIMRKEKRSFFGYWGYAEDLMVMSLWPIFMYLVLADISGVGLFSTIATLIGTVIMLYIGKIADLRDKLGLIQRAAVVYSATWILRFLAIDPGTVLAFDVLGRTSKDALNVPMVSLTYERAGGKNADYAIAYSVFYELSLSVGKIVTALAAILILSLTGNIFLVFAVVGLMTLLYGLLK